MSGLGAAALRELGAVPRKFLTVKGALLWYRDELARRVRVSSDPAAVGSPRNQAREDETVATFAAIAQCLKRAHYADIEPESAAFLSSGERLCWLVASYEARWGDNCWLADRANLTRWSFTRLCKRTERVLQTRMRAAGIVET